MNLACLLQWPVGRGSPPQAGALEELKDVPSFIFKRAVSFKKLFVVVMDNLIQKTKYYITPRKKTIPEQCTQYIKENPTTVAKGVVGGVAAWYVIPIAFGMIGWLPYIGATYYVYHNTSVDDSYSWYQWGKSWVGI
uniref:Transmembrane protein n=2 Tax=root TaxID=1 RepID=A0A481YXS4_9VIRU|nr:MAG: hypothetical protein LCMAC202_00570 [Marseillevirus LCMAC202]